MSEASPPNFKEAMQAARRAAPSGSEYGREIDDALRDLEARGVIKSGMTIQRMVEISRRYGRTWDAERGEFVPSDFTTTWQVPIDELKHQVADTIFHHGDSPQARLDLFVLETRLRLQELHDAREANQQMIRINEVLAWITVLAALVTAAASLIVGLAA